VLILSGASSTRLSQYACIAEAFAPLRRCPNHGVHSPELPTARIKRPCGAAAISPTLCIHVNVYRDPTTHAATSRSTIAPPPHLIVLRMRGCGLITAV
jgi:hypothetical protein